MAVLGLGGNPINWANPPEPTDKVMWSGLTTSGKPVIGSFRTIAHLDYMDGEARRLFGVGIRVMQGPFNDSVAQSKGTHDGDACLDIEIPGVPWAQQEWFVRVHGGGAYWRKPSQGFVNHIHYFVLPPYVGPDVSKGYMQAGFKVGELVDGGWSTRGARVTSSQIEDYYEHKTALKGHAHDPSRFPADIRATIFNLREYVMEKQTDYHWYQPGKVGSPQSACALGVRKTFGAMSNKGIRVGSAATSEGGGIRMRPILRARAKGNEAHKGLAFSNAVGHAPPPRSPKARARFMKVFAAVKTTFKGGDLNLSKRLAERAVGNRVVGSGVLWLVVPRTGWNVYSVRAVNVNGDHKAVLVIMIHKKTKVHVRFLVINCMSVSTGKVHAAEILAAGLALKPDIIMATECADFSARVVDARN